MNTDIFIKKPVLAIVLNLVLVFVGLISFFKLEVRLYPNIDPSVITVTTDYTGASAQDVELFITTPIEDSLEGIEGLDYTESKSSEGQSVVTIHFVSGYDINNAMSNVVSQVAAVKHLLPEDAYDSVISQYNPDDQPVIWLSLISDSLDRNELSAYFLDNIKPQLQNVKGLARATPFGLREYAIRVKLDPEKIWAHNLSVNEVISKLSANSQYLPAGSIKTHFNEYDVSLHRDLYTASSFEKLIITDKSNGLIRLGDLANISMSSKNINKSAFFQGKPALFAGLYQSPGANPIELSKIITDKLATISQQNKALVINTLWDSSRFIEESIDEVTATIFEASVFVILVTLLFLGSFRAVFVPSLAIPLSLIGVMTFMLVLGYSLNTFTLLAMVLAIGMVVDDAIVVLENIHRHMELGLSPMQAALVGAREIRFAVIVMTLTLAAVFTPVGFIGGSSGRLFSEFAFTLAGSVIVSGFVALTLSPMICSRLLKLESNSFTDFLETNFHILSNIYSSFLKKIIGYKKIILCTMVVIFISTIALYKLIPSTIVPEEDSGSILTFISGPENANISYTEAQTKSVIDVFSQIEDANFYGLVNGFGNQNAAMGIMRLKDWGNRLPLNDIIKQKLFVPLMSIPGIKAFPVNSFSVPGSSLKTPVSFVVKTEGDYDELYYRMQNMIQYLQQTAPFLLNLQSSLKISKRAFNVAIDRDTAEQLGVDIYEISKAIFYALGESTVSNFVYNNRNYDVISELSSKYRNNIDSLNLITVRSSNGSLVPLSSLVTTTSEINAATLPHFQSVRAITLTAILVPGFPLGVALDIVKSAADKFFDGSNFSIDYSGQSRDFVLSQGVILPLFFCALIFIFLVLSAQYESFIDPFIILTTVPLSTFGALLAIKLIGGSLNLYTNVGILTLIGLVSKHGILIVDFANVEKSKGVSVVDAVVNACKIRLRPILATTAAMVLGAIPLAFSAEPGAAARYEIGWCIIGGMLVGTIMSLFVVPVFYTMLSKER